MARTGWRTGGARLLTILAAAAHFGGCARQPAPVARAAVQPAASAALEPVPSGLIAVAREREDGIWVVELVDTRGTSLRELWRAASSDAEVTQLAWSPSGDRVAFARRSYDPWSPGERGFELEVAAADGSGSRVVCERLGFTYGDRMQPGLPADLEWSPSGRLIAVGLNMGDAEPLPGPGVMVVEVATGGRALDLPGSRTHVAGGEWTGYGDPQWGPNDAALFMKEYRPAPGRYVERLVLRDLGLGRAAELCSGAPISGYAVAPGGGTVAVSTTQPEDTLLLLLAYDGAEWVERSAAERHGAPDNRLVWAPDAARLAYSRDEPGTSNQVFVCGAAQKAETRVTPGEDGWYWAVCGWLPDSEHVVCLRTPWSPTRGRGDGPVTLWIAAADGSGVTQVPGIEGDSLVAGPGPVAEMSP